MNKLFCTLKADMQMVNIIYLPKTYRICKIISVEAGRNLRLLKEQIKKVKSSLCQKWLTSTQRSGATRRLETPTRGVHVTLVQVDVLPSDGCLKTIHCQFSSLAIVMFCKVIMNTGPQLLGGKQGSCEPGATHSTFFSWLIYPVCLKTLLNRYCWLINMDSLHAKM